MEQCNSNEMSFGEHEEMIKNYKEKKKKTIKKNYKETIW